MNFLELNFSECSLPSTVSKKTIRMIDRHTRLRTFARIFFNIDFFLKILPLKDDELVMSEM